MALDYLNDLNLFKQIQNKNKISINGSNDMLNITMIAMDFFYNKKSLFVVLPDLYLAQKYYDELIKICDFDDVLFFPCDEVLTVDMLSLSGDFKYERINTIASLLSGRKKIVVTHALGAIKLELNKEIWSKSNLKLKVNDSIDINDLCNKLITMGYEKTYTTISTGQFSRRGSIVDIFALSYSEPIRIDFFDDEIETIKTYDIDTQRSKEKINEINIMPVTELLYDIADTDFIVKRINSFLASNNFEEDVYNKVLNDIHNIKNHTNLDSLAKYIEFFPGEKCRIFDFVLDKSIYVVDYNKVKDIYKRTSLEIIGSNGVSRKLNFFTDVEFLKDYKIIEGVSSILNPDIKINCGEEKVFNGNLDKALLFIKSNLGLSQIFVSFTNKDMLKVFIEAMLENHIPYSYSEINKEYVNVIRDFYLPSFILKDEEVIVLNEDSIFKRETKVKSKYKSVYKSASKISRYDELRVGDYVVHYDYGIGKYLGIKTMGSGDILRDYLHVSYNKGDLYIPVEQIKSIMKYASYETEGVNLSTIGGTQWAKTKASVRKRIHDISAKLINLYARRSNSVGHQYLPDSDMQDEFEGKFMYELTYDQHNAILDVKRDMESKRPMDRLICGDVGYGKTEVALRAAFKAAYEHKQVCVLCPTTILARQHFHTFKDRMQDFGVRVELINRFVDRRKQTQIINDLKEGLIDVIVGTHRVLSQEIKFKDLGLLIVDEEQRFGVTHKEKIKELKVNVDTITLSATPIPRTLQMSILGIKDLSMIETPPKNRYPVQTYVLQRNDTIIKEAIERELSRGGQVFYLYNFVDDIMDIKDHISKLVPGIKIGVGHGKLKKDELENVITSFIDKEYDLLLCTTIIETGIDMPDTNTLIIHDADRLGLSQLYQIRGRVGRSNKIAYAYMMYEPNKILTTDAEKRLDTIKEFNELGSGYKIAMRDLSIRGAGDLLGEEQSGFVESVGIDIYLKMLEEEVEIIKNGKKKEEESISSSKLAPLASRSISNDYISSGDIKIEIHKKIDKLKCNRDISILCEELVDRFGNIDEDLLLYMEESVLQKYLMKLHIYKTETKIFMFNMYMDKDFVSNIDGTKLFKTAFSISRDIILNYRNSEIIIGIDTSKYSKLEYFRMLNKLFEEMLK